MDIGLMVLVITAVIGYTVYNLQLEKQQAELLKEKYVTNLEIVFDFKDHVANVMYNMSAYSLSGTESYYEEGVQSMADAADSLVTFKKFIDQFPDDTMFLEQYQNAMTAHSTYATEIQDTYDVMNDINLKQLCSIA